MGIRDTPTGHPPHHRANRARWRGAVVPAVVLVIAAAVLIASVPLPPAWQRAWASVAYPALQTRLSTLAAALPFAVLDLLVVGIGSLAAWLVVQVARRRLRWRPMVGGVALALALGWLAFQMLWGWHYQAPTLEARLVRGGEIPSARATEVATHAVHRLNRLHADAHAHAWPAPADRPERLAAAMHDVLRDLGVWWEPVLPASRHSLVDPYFRRAGIDGLTNPFGLEVVLNGHLLDIERPSVLAHEWAHLAGFADESDAGFVGWMAGVRAGGQQEYAAWIDVLPHLAGALLPDARSAVLGALEAGPEDDLRAIAARAADRWPALQEAAWRVYDRFLKANRVSEGIARYDAVTRLLLTAADERTGRLRQSVPAP